MSSPGASPFASWDTLLDSSPTLQASALPSPALSQGSGEFNQFVSIGAVVAGGGGKKLFSLLHSDRLVQKCLGAVASSKFCIKECEQGKSYCGISSHELRKVELSPETFYIKEIDGRCLLNPTFKVMGLSELGVDQILERKATMKELESLFDDIRENRVDPRWWQATVKPVSEMTLGKDLTKRQADNTVDKLELESAKFATADLGIFGVPPKLSFDSEEEEGTCNEGQPLEEKAFVLAARCHKHLQTLKSKWSQTFLEVEASHSSVLKDLQILKNFSLELDRSLGQPEADEEDIPHSAWQRIGMLIKALSSFKTELVAQQEVAEVKFEELENNQEYLHVELEETVKRDVQNHTNLQSSLQRAEKKIAMLEATIEEYEKRFNHILPILLEARRSSFLSPISGDRSPGLAVPSLALTTLQEQFKLLATRMDSMVAGSYNELAGGTPAEDLQDLKHQVRILQQRIVGGGVHIGSKTFQSFEDVQVWVETELPNQRYGLFVDAVSLLDFFSFLGHVDTERQLSAFHSQQKAGFATQYESRVATSIQNLFPHVFGKTGADESQYLPGVPSPDKWDSGTHGLKHAISKGMGLVEKQVENAIQSVLHPYPEAFRIAQECLYKSKRFITELCTFISEDFQKWKSRGHGKVDAWHMTAVCVRRIFEEIHAERIVARDGYDHQDQQFTTARILWATWKAHMVMERYLKHQFYEHPAVAAVLSRHLADNYVKPDDTVSAKVVHLEKSMKALQAQVDRLTSLERENKGTRTKMGKFIQPKEE